MENTAKRTQKRSGTNSNLNNGQDSEKPVFICDYCEKEFSFSSKLKIHVKVHTGQKDFHCNLCKFSASQKGNFETHIRRHLKERNFKCPELNCGASFVTSGELKQHESNHHNKNNKKFICSFCPYKTASKSHLTSHMKNIHSESRPFKCPHGDCEYSTKQKSTLNQHLKIHSAEENQVCSHPNCGYKTKKSSYLKKHMKIHSTGEKSHRCHFCEYSSHQHGDLVVHIRRHTGENPFSCQLCSFKSKQKGHLNSHMKIHAD